MFFSWKKRTKRTSCGCCYRVLIEIEPIFSTRVWAIVNQSDIAYGAFAQMRGRNTRTAGYRVFLFYCEEWHLNLIGSVAGKFRSSLFKGLRFPKAEPWSLVATSETLPSGFSFCKAFSFGPFASKEKALSAKNNLWLGERTVGDACPYRIWWKSYCLANGRFLNRPYGF